MYSDKENANSLTAMLIAAGIRDIVACPGSRNAVLAHNFHEAARLHGCFRLHSVVDERSASFFAIGIWLATRKPVVVCVTSGSALLNTLPGVAEAYYRQVPLVIISADRPARWIGQLDGQTIVQPGALQPYARCIQMDSKLTADDVPTYNPLMPLHINVPIEEPLFNFTTAELPVPEFSFFEQQTESSGLSAKLDEAAAIINQAKLPAVVIGQYEGEAIDSLIELDKQDKLLLLPEIISNHPGAERTAWIESAKAEGIAMPDVVVHVGGALVNKWLKIKLRQQEPLKVIRVDKTDEAPDTFSHLEMKVKCDEKAFFDALLPLIVRHQAVAEFKNQVAEHKPAPSSAEEIAMAYLWDKISGMSPCDTTIFLGNSTAVRMAARLFKSGSVPMFCNRGINGIEGSVSVAAGYSAVTKRDVYTIVGDLSFFYDVNALWNRSLRNNLRVLMFNDHKGGIFSRLPGLATSPALDDFIAARHNANAKGIAMSYGCSYQAVHSEQEFRNALEDFTGKNHNNTDKPKILEYDTDLEQNQRLQ
jgi:2-succinyl-5-enolpyruvyl-6-hydroxy-3-cyclohexene-1-carboxylate synthase